MKERIFKAEGLVLRTRALGEADRLVTLLTLELGKFEAVARGARKIKSKLAAGVDLFTYGRFNFHRGRTWPIITGQDSIKHFRRFREDPALYPYGLYLAELADHFVSGEGSCPEICRLLRDGWELLEEDIEPKLLCRAFELKIASFSGYKPGLYSCLRCGSPRVHLFSPRQGGVLCPDCPSADGLQVDPGTLALACRLIEAPLTLIKKIKPGRRQLIELFRMNSAFLNYHLDLDGIKSRKMLVD